MINDSSTGGVLSPAASPAPFEGAALSAFIHDLIQSITNLPGQSIVPRWQPEPPNLATFGTNWCAFGITARVADFNAYIRHVDASPPYDELQRHEILDILTSFYGPDADGFVEVFREGLQIPQNREALQRNSMGLIETGDAITLPALVKDRWLYRVDLSAKIKRQIVRQYPILDLASATTTLNNEQYLTTIAVTP